MMGRTVRMSRMSVLSKIPGKKCPKFKKMYKNKKKMSKNKINCTIFRGLWNRCCNSTRSTSLLNGSGRYENKISDSEKKMSNIKIYCSKFQRERERERERERAGYSISNPEGPGSCRNPLRTRAGEAALDVHHSLTHSLTHSRTQSLTLSLTHSLTHSLTFSDFTSSEREREREEEREKEKERERWGRER